METPYISAQGGTCKPTTNHAPSKCDRPLSLFRNVGACMCEVGVLPPFSHHGRESARGDRRKGPTSTSRDSANAAVCSPHLFARFQSLTPIDFSGGNGLLAHLFQPVLFNTMISVHCAEQIPCSYTPPLQFYLCSKRERRMWSFLPDILFSSPSLPVIVPSIRTTNIIGIVVLLPQRLCCSGK